MHRKQHEITKLYRAPAHGSTASLSSPAEYTWCTCPAPSCWEQCHQGSTPGQLAHIESCSMWKAWCFTSPFSKTSCFILHCAVVVPLPFETDEGVHRYWKRWFSIHGSLFFFDMTRLLFSIPFPARLTSRSDMAGNLDLSWDIWPATHCSIFSSFLALHPSNVAASKQNRCTELEKGRGSMARTGRRK